MKEKINTQGVEVNRIGIDYIKPGHEGVQLLIKYYNTIPTTSTHRIFQKIQKLTRGTPFNIVTTPLTKRT